MAEDGASAALGGAPATSAGARGGAPMKWNGALPPSLPDPTLPEKGRGGLRLAAALAVTGVCLVLYLLFRVVEKRVWSGFRWRERVQRSWARIMARLSGLTVRRVGVPMSHGGALVSNHSSWSDIFVLVGAARMTFVSKDDVRGWPGVGWIAALCDTIFIERRRAAAKAQTEEMARRMAGGERLLFFPEGTSTDGLRVLPFRSTLFGAFMDDALRESAWVQPVSVVYHPGPGLPRAFHGWWGDMDFGASVWDVLCLSVGGSAEVVFHDPVRPSAFADRKALAAHCGREVERGVAERL
ncbi:MAG: lysophospholipid acyltransferase family protein [Pseudomonadota bacterium]